MKTVRIREKIKKFLGDRPRNTAEILEHTVSNRVRFLLARREHLRTLLSEVRARTASERRSNIAFNERLVPT